MPLEVIPTIGELVGNAHYIKRGEHILLPGYLTGRGTVIGVGCLPDDSAGVLFELERAKATDDYVLPSTLFELVQTSIRVRYVPPKTDFELKLASPAAIKVSFIFAHIAEVKEI